MARKDREQQKKRTKRQHIVPQLHLRRFVGEQPKNMVWTYDTERETVRPSTVEATGFGTNFYSVQLEDGSYFDGLDEWLGSVENAASAPYEMLLAGEFPSGQARMDFATFVASLFARSPALIRAHAEGFGQFLQLQMDYRFSDRPTFERSMDQFEADTGKKYDRDRLFDFWRDKDRYHMTVSQKTGLAAMSVADELSPIFFDRHWYLIDAADDFFITSDSPVFRFVQSDDRHPLRGDGGFKNPAAEVTVPLSPTRMLLMTGHRLQARRFAAVSETVWNMNSARAYQAERFLYSHAQDDRVLQLAKEHKDDKLRFHLGTRRKLAKVKVSR